MYTMLAQLAHRDVTGSSGRKEANMLQGHSASLDPGLITRKSASSVRSALICRTERPTGTPGGNETRGYDSYSSIDPCRRLKSASEGR